MSADVAASTHAADRTRSAIRFIVPVGRVLFAAIFVASGPGHFSQNMVGYAAAQGVPMAKLAVPVAGILALLGGLGIALGYRARLGAWLLVIFLVPVTLYMHAFWGVKDPQMAMMQQVSFMKNVSMLGGALLLAYFGAGPVSLDARRTTPGL
ncbi:MAG TPA: DoxX family protein [Anaeromyxobacter sp.]